MRLLGAAGFVLIVLHTSAVTCAALAEPRFFDPYHALSDLGVEGKPHAALVNSVAFIATGLLIAAFGAGSLFVFQPKWRFVLAGGSFTIGGGALAYAGAFPFPSPLHIPSAAVASIFLSAGIAMFGTGYARILQSRKLAAGSLITAAIVAFHVALIPANIPAPGYVSKMAFASALAWFCVISSVLVSGSTDQGKTSGLRFHS